MGTLKKHIFRLPPDGYRDYIFHLITWVFMGMCNVFPIAIGMSGCQPAGWQVPIYKCF
ncbi:hypothetical protein [uncultured Mucilaginibacter sp.]|uniref:hypothetical protein n=1 Tax=uncultured Mucilaginibacter sp. TaxID=797541 RepID=UPI0025E4B507|nr:hypothetical protein [uncultured Mucilaginibacter sp.]